MFLTPLYLQEKGVKICIFNTLLFPFYRGKKLYFTQCLRCVGLFVSSLFPSFSFFAPVGPHTAQRYPLWPAHVLQMAYNSDQMCSNVLHSAFEASLLIPFEYTLHYELRASFPRTDSTRGQWCILQLLFPCMYALDNCQAVLRRTACGRCSSHRSVCNASRTAPGSHSRCRAITA